LQPCTGPSRSVRPDLSAPGPWEGAIGGRRGRAAPLGMGPPCDPRPGQRDGPAAAGLDRFPIEAPPAARRKYGPTPVQQQLRDPDGPTGTRGGSSARA
jgi:hypothetical protein